ncbi:hypothetical protein P154DRAFT_360487 [Amniculicola lignicola CBS 123094]|uniref:L-ornithine N(5)-monooxygenase [NAD(P)H] n=1 Tax=Amniculicola lignicola CBS 123094 TaxID=1392246 RepID=A0A6A5WBH3_9PLEO|nr:hypothetical protein P154DRAFT_360487 [Amniculicola lignicola CBS 123094]
MASLDPIQRPTSPTASSSPAYDLVCIGFGPAQLATAIANQESKKPANILFLERKPLLSWHTSDHLPRSRIENPFIYDLATTRNPRTKYSYINYLQAKGRLVEFANSDRMNPLRAEFDDYLQWCAEDFKNQVRYGSEVVGVVPEKGDGAVRGWSVAVKDQNGRTHMVRARSIAAPAPAVKSESKPEALLKVNFEAGQRFVPMAEYAARRNELREMRDPPLNIFLVGSSQQTVEILDDLLSCQRLGNITVHSDNESLRPLKLLSNELSPPEPRLCSIWARPSCDSKSWVPSASELVQNIYTKAYEKQLSSKGQFRLRIVDGTGATESALDGGIIISEAAGPQLSTSGLFHGLDSLVLGCRQKGESLEEVQFKRGAVAEGCRMWLMAANSEGGRSLAKDLAVRAGEVVKGLQVGQQGRDGLVAINARM